MNWQLVTMKLFIHLPFCPSLLIWFSLGIIFCNFTNFLSRKSERNRQPNRHLPYGPYGPLRAKGPGLRAWQWAKPPKICLEISEPLRSSFQQVDITMEIHYYMRNPFSNGKQTHGFPPMGEMGYYSHSILKQIVWPTICFITMNQKNIDSKFDSTTIWAFETHILHPFQSHYSTNIARSYPTHGWPPLGCHPV